MALANTTSHYGSIARSFHWLIALLVLTVVPLGVVANDLSHRIELDPSAATDRELGRAIFLFSLHKTIGAAIFIVALLRIVWACIQPKPEALHPERRLETFMAELVHWLLYGSLVLVPLTGWIAHATEPGYAPIWGPFPQSFAFVPQSSWAKEFFSGLHLVMTYVMMGSIGLHIMGALKHSIIDKDLTLARMLRGAEAAGSTAQLRHMNAFIPIIAAVIVWIGSIGVGAATGILHLTAAEPIPTETAEMVTDAAQATGNAPEWTVNSANLAVTINKVGSDIEGGFSAFDTAIRFDPETGEGAVDVIVDISSFEIGSDTSNALSPAFLDQATFPTARYTGPISPGGDAGEFVIDGVLNLKGVSLPAPLQFTLDQSGNDATARGEMVINRQDYAIGDNISDEDSLAFSVIVSVNINASRSSR